ncbi:hypothetical protein KSS87_001861 [Heliosperma pusillum]|nr:hypothetical protein KSS87_018420 [Heliosperma pusillum]KAH9622021.1 hypothetical protein KSS87_001861 [Heliosperma pusillum]
MASATGGQLFIKPQHLSTIKKLISAHQPISEALAFTRTNQTHNLSILSSSHRNPNVAVKSSPGKQSATSTDNDEGVSLGTMKLPLDTDVPRFETLLFQWANSLCQGAQLPLPMPLKVDKIEGGVNIGFVEIDDGKTEVSVYINCLVVPGSNASESPKFIATRKGALRNKVPPGEPRIMKSLLAALQKSVEIARVS